MAAFGAATALALGGCGGGSGDEPPASYDVTAGEFIELIQPEKQSVLEDFVTESETCQDVKANPAFTLVVTSAALEADPGSPLPEVIEAEC